MQKAQFYLYEKLHHSLKLKINDYRALFRGVILQAFIDSVSNCKRTETKLAKSSARAWLTGMCYDFKIVCAIAEYNPYYIKRKAIEFIQENKNASKIIHDLRSLEEV